MEALGGGRAPRPDGAQWGGKVAGPATHASIGAVPLTEASRPSPPTSLTGNLEPPIAVTPPPTRRPIIANTSPPRYRVQFTIGNETHDPPRRPQALLRREIPDGAAIA